MNLSPLDTARWQVTTARADEVTAAGLPALLADCGDRGVKFLIARCPASDLAAARAMEHAGFELMDTLVYYSRALADLAAPGIAGIVVREVASGEHRAVKEVARHAFAGYLGHYHADPRLDRRQCDELYADWAERSCLSREVADQVLVGTLGGEIVSFITLRLENHAGEGLLFGVAPASQRRGIGGALMRGAMHWLKARGRSSMVISTHLTNIAVQRTWARLGFELTRSHYTFHKWF